MRFITFIIVFGLPFFSLAQDSGRLSVNAYFDAYYSHFTDDLPLNSFQQFTTVSARDNQLGINAMQLGVVYEHKYVRGALTLHYGDIAKATWSEEFQQVQEGYAGIRITDGLWLDAGFFTTHVGTESFLPKNNLLSSTAVATYIGPFYQSGARLSWEGTERLTAQFHVINGYNQFLDRNRAKSYGVFLQYTFSEGFNLTYTNMLGRESEEDAPADQYLVYQNVYGQWENGPWQLVAGGDIAFQSNSELDGDGSARMLNFLTTVRYAFTEKVSATGRIEWYDDPDGFLSGVLTAVDGPRGLVMTGYTAGLEYRPMSASFLRAETRYLRTEDELDIFTDDTSLSNERWEFMLTIGVYLEDLVLSGGQ